MAEDLRARGGEIRTSALVEKIVGDAKRATAVRLTSGEEIPASELIVSNIDPGHLIIDLLGAEIVGADIVDKMKLYEWGDSVLSCSSPSRALLITRPDPLRGNQRMFISPNRHSIFSRECIWNAAVARCRRRQ